MEVARGPLGQPDERDDGTIAPTAALGSLNGQLDVLDDWGRLLAGVLIGHVWMALTLTALSVLAEGWSPMEIEQFRTALEASGAQVLIEGSRITLSPRKRS